MSSVKVEKEIATTLQKKNLEILRAKFGGSKFQRGKGAPRRKKVVRKNKKNPKQLLDDLLEKVYTNEVSNVSGIYLLNKNGEPDMHFNFPKVQLVAKASAYVIHGTATKTMKEDSSSDEENEEASQTTEPGITVEDVKDVKEEDTDDKKLEEIPSEDPLIKTSNDEKEVHTQNKWERRFRAMVAKAGLKPKKMPYSKVRFILKDQKFMAKEADVEKITPDAYLIYGKIEIESADQITQLAEEFGKTADFSKIKNSNMGEEEDDDDDMPDLIPAEDNAVLTDNKFSETDVAMVMDQTTATRKEAIKALTENEGDMIEAIMNLT